MMIIKVSYNSFTFWSENLALTICFWPMSIKHIITYEMINEKRTILKEKIWIYGITCIWQFYKVKEPQGLSYADLVYIVRYQQDNCMIILKDL